jgi:glycosyl transferase family 25
MRIFLINLDRSPDRLAFMTAQLEVLGLQAERLPAVDGNNVDPSPHSSSGLRPGEIGCFLSHRAAWQRLVASGDTFALVLEDDVRLSQALPDVLDVVTKLGGNAGIFKLDTSGRSIAVDADSVAGGGRIGFARLCSEHTGTAGYILSAEAAAELLTRSSAFFQPVDLFMFGKGAVTQSSPRIFQAVPAVVAQEKRFRAVHDTEMSSVIHRQKPASAPVIAKGFKEVRRWLRKLAAFARSLPSRIKGTRKYLRVPFV